MSNTINYKVKYDFYKEYINIKNNTKYNNFQEKLNIRLEKIKNLYFLYSLTNELIIKEYFVEIFSWSVFPLEILKELGEILQENNISGVIDPCCGNAFHTYLFKNYLEFNVYSVDIQEEINSWTNIEEIDGRLFLEKLSSENHNKNALLLSWVDYESLTQDLLKLYRGNIIISVGNYENLSKNYIIDLQKNFTLIKKYNLVMPWNLEEKIEIYIRKL